MLWTFQKHHVKSGNPKIRDYVCLVMTRRRPLASVTMKSIKELIIKPAAPRNFDHNFSVLAFFEFPILPNISFFRETIHCSYSRWALLCF